MEEFMLKTTLLLALLLIAGGLSRWSVPFFCCG